MKKLPKAGEEIILGHYAYMVEQVEHSPKVVLHCHKV